MSEYREMNTENNEYLIANQWQQDATWIADQMLEQAQSHARSMERLHRKLMNILNRGNKKDGEN